MVKEVTLLVGLGIEFSPEALAIAWTVAGAHLEGSDCSWSPLISGCDQSLPVLAGVGWNAMGLRSDRICVDGQRI